MNKPRVAVIVPTLNSARTLEACLASVRSQRVETVDIDLVVSDGGSEDGSVEIARRFGARIVENPLKTGEAGKAAGISRSSAEFVAMIDSDNILDSQHWLETMLMPFREDDAIVAAEPIEYTWRSHDPPLVRYFALLGMNDPLCLFVGNYDRMSSFTGRWTDLPVMATDRGGHIEVNLEPNRMLPTIGANGTVVRRSVLDKVRWSPYYVDTDVIAQLAQMGLGRVAKVKCGIVHLYCNSLRSFARKQDRRIRDFLFYNRQGMRSHTWHKEGRLQIGIAKFVASCVLAVPLLWQIGKAWRRRRDWALMFHLPACWVTLSVYARAVAGAGRFRFLTPASRSGWGQ